MSDKEKMYNDPLYKMTADEKYGPSLTAEEIQQMNEENAKDTAEMRAALFGGLKKYGTMAVKFVCSDDYPDMTAWFRDFSELNAYGKSVDEAADRLRDVMEEQLFAQPQYALNGEFLHDLQIRRAVEQIIEEEILKELVYVANF